MPEFFLSENQCLVGAIGLLVFGDDTMGVRFVTRLWDLQGFYGRAMGGFEGVETDGEEGEGEAAGCGGGE